MDRKLTIDDIARELNISKTTVSRAISGKGRIGQETKAKVMGYIKENNYKPSAIAKGLAQSKTFNISFVMSGESLVPDLSFYHEFLWEISRVASESEYDVIVSMIKEGNMTQLTRVIENNKVDGVVLGKIFDRDVVGKYLKDKDVPFVALETFMDVLEKCSIAELAEECFDKLLSYIDK